MDTAVVVVAVQLDGTRTTEQIQEEVETFISPWFALSTTFTAETETQLESQVRAIVQTMVNAAKS